MGGREGCRGEVAGGCKGSRLVEIWKHKDNHVYGDHVQSAIMCIYIYKEA